MKQRMKKTRNILLYTVYGIALALGLLHFRFPAEAYMEYLQDRVRQVDSRFNASAESVRPLLPLGLRFVSPRIAMEDRSDAALFKARSLLVTRRIGGWLKGRNVYDFDARAYGGGITGNADLRENDVRAPLSAVVRLDNINLLDHEYLQVIARQPVSGRLAGTLAFHGVRDRWIEGEGKADLRILNGRVALKNPVWRFDAIHIDEANVVMALKERRLLIERVAFRGKEVEGSMTGTIQLKDVLRESRLNLRGTVRPLPSLSKMLGGLLGRSLSSKLKLNTGVSFVIHGTIDEPDIKIM